MQETWVWSLGQEDPLEKEMATHSSTLAWKIPWMEEHGRLQSMGSKRARHDWATSRIKARFVVQLFNYIHSLWPRGLQHTRLPCPSLSPGVTQICPLSHWCHPIISSSVTPFSSCPQSSSPATVSFPVSQFFASGGQSIGASASILSMNIQDWFPLGWTDLISLQSKGLSRVLSSTTVQKHHFFSVQPYLWTHLLWTTTLTSACDYWKKHTLTIWTFAGKLMSLLFNMLSRFLMALLPRSRHFFLISCLQSPSTVILVPKKITSVTISIVSPLFVLQWWDWVLWS